MCVWSICVTKYLNAEIKEDRYFVNEVKTQLREKPLQVSQTQKIHYSKDKASYKALVLTYLWCCNHRFNSDTYLNVNTSQLGLLSWGVFNGLL
jgi:hypothetical protein